MKEMTIKEVLFGSALYIHCMYLKNNGEVGPLQFIADGFAGGGPASILSASHNGDISFALIIRDGSDTDTRVKLGMKDIGTPEGWSVFLSKHKKVSAAINAIPFTNMEETDVGYKDEDLIENVTTYNPGSWVAVEAAYKIAYSLAHYMMKLIYSRKLNLKVNRRKSIWMTPTANLKVVTIEASDTTDGKEYPMIRITRYTNSTKHKFELCLNDCDDTTWEPLLRKLILFALSGQAKDVMADFVKCITTVVCKATYQYSFCSNSGNFNVESTLSEYIPVRKMKPLTSVEMPRWMMVGETEAIECRLVCVDIIGDILDNDAGVIVTPCTTRHAPIYNKQEIDITKINSDACTWVTTVKAARS